MQHLHRCFCDDFFSVGTQYRNGSGIAAGDWRYVALFQSGRQFACGQLSVSWTGSERFGGGQETPRQTQRLTAVQSAGNAADNGFMIDLMA